MNFTAVILAGGRSVRMGRDKALLPVEGQPLLARQIETVRAAGAAEILISGRPEYAAFGCRVIQDNYLDIGPLAGIEAALLVAAHPLLLVLAVDLPHMTADYLRQLLADCTPNLGAIPCHQGCFEPLAAVYPRAAHPLALAQIRAGVYAVHTFAALCAPIAHTIPTPCFTNWNHPLDVDLTPQAVRPN